MLVQAEHIDAVNCIESIVQIDGLDGIMLGLYDLSASMGKMGQVTDPRSPVPSTGFISPANPPGSPLAISVSTPRRFDLPKKGQSHPRRG